MDAESDFPKFKDGDVCIVVSARRIFQLHSHTLRRLSPFFARELGIYPGATLTAAAKRNGASPYRFELNKNDPDDIGRLVRIGVLDNGRPHRDRFTFPNIDNDLETDEKEGRLWDWLFGSFYHIKPSFEDHNLGTIVQCCMGLVDRADSIDALDHVCGIVDHALLNQDRNLWTSISKNPTAWTELGCRIRSHSIFCEGMIHLVGMWQSLAAEEKDELRPEIRALCELKHQELDFAKQAIDMRILGHYPDFLHRDHEDKPDRTSYSTDIYMWMAVSFFRHYYAQAISENRTRNNEDGGFAFYNVLAAGGNDYLTHEDFDTFYKYFPMSGKACNVLEANMTVLKRQVQAFVEDLVVVRTHVRPDEYVDCQIQWLTCAVIEKSDCPWETDGDANDSAVAAALRSNMEMSTEHDHFDSEADTVNLDTRRDELSRYEWQAMDENDDVHGHDGNRDQQHRSKNRLVEIEEDDDDDDGSEEYEVVDASTRHGNRTRRENDHDDWL